MKIVTAPGPVYHGPFHKITAFTGWGNGVRSGKYVAIAYRVAPFCIIVDTDTGASVTPNPGAVASGAAGLGISWCALNGDIAVSRSDATVIYSAEGGLFLERSRFSGSPGKAEYSTDGTQIALPGTVSGLRTGCFHVLNSLTFAEVPTPAPDYDTSMVRWSPDGAWIAFIENASYPALRVLSTVDWSTSVAFSDGVQGIDFIKWSLDSSRLMAGSNTNAWFLVDLGGWPTVAFNLMPMLPSGMNVPTVSMSSIILAQGFSVAERRVAFGVDARPFVLEVFKGPYNDRDFLAVVGDEFTWSTRAEGVGGFNPDPYPLDGFPRDAYFFPTSYPGRAYYTYLSHINVYGPTWYAARAPGFQVGINELHVMHKRQDSPHWTTPWYVVDESFVSEPGYLAGITSTARQLNATSSGDMFAMVVGESAWVTLVLSPDFLVLNHEVAEFGSYPEQSRPEVFWSHRGDLGYITNGGMLRITPLRTPGEQTNLTVTPPDQDFKNPRNLLEAAFSPYIKTPAP